MKLVYLLMTKPILWNQYFHCIIYFWGELLEKLRWVNHMTMSGGVYSAGMDSLPPVIVRNIFIDFTAQMAALSPTQPPHHTPTESACFHGKSNYIVFLRAKATLTTTEK